MHRGDAVGHGGIMMTVSHARDPGLQSERTQLSWQRTALSTLILTVVMMRTAIIRHHVLLIAVSILSIIMALLLLLISYQQRDTEYYVHYHVSPFGKRLVTAILSLNALIVVISHMI